MANWNRKKVIRLASGFAGRSKSCFGLALRKVHRAAQYAYRDRRVKKRLMRSNWIQSINAGVREHGLTYSVFANALVKKSNIELDRKILQVLAVTEPYSFKSVIDEVKVQAGIAEIPRRKPLVAGM
jgi:large subunit ribosomal protein L20